MLAATPAGTSIESDEPFTLSSPLEAESRRVECQPLPDTAPEDPSTAFELMKTGPEIAVACVDFLEDNIPDWHRAEGARELVVPFVSYLLGDGTVRGLNRHQIFIDLLGHLEKIDPGWRFDPSVEALMPRMIVGSVVEDPFVAEFWSTTLREMDPDWRESEAARSLVPVVYRQALEEEQSPGNRMNERPAALLKQLSWSRYAWLKVYADALDTWPKRIVLAALALVALTFAARKFRRR